MELAEQSPTSSFADVNKLSCAIHSIQKSPQDFLVLLWLGPSAQRKAWVDARRVLLRATYGQIGLS